MMEKDFLPTDYIKAVYANKAEEGAKQWKSIYEPTHVLKLGTTPENAHDEGDYFQVDDNKGAEHYGYEGDNVAFNKALTTCVWWVWDKTTRRLFLYHDKDWTWPLWVWDDPLKLDTFFPYFPLSFLVDPECVTSKGEVTFYLDQQDAINDINSEHARALHWARRKIVYNTKLLSREKLDAFLQSDEQAIGIDMEEGSKLTDHFFSVTPPSVAWQELFNKDQKLQAIDRVSSVSDVLRGAQFKTNTTNQAIQNYNATTNLRVDEKTDQIEDWLSNIAWALAQLCLMYMPVEMVSTLIGQTQAQGWRNLQPDEIKSLYRTFGVAAGSTTKPTSQFKKQEAIQIGQVLGQFASASPAVILVMLKVMERAFDEVVIRQEDWQLIEQSVQMAMMPQPAPAGPGQTDPAQGQPTQGQPQQQQQPMSPVDMVLAQRGRPAA
jgi:hypothetical protein